MSGPIPPKLAQAAETAALLAEAAARGMTPGRLIGARLRASLDKHAKRERDSLPARTWRDIDPSVRTTLVMLASDAPGDPRHLAVQPWESFSDKDRAALAATARMFARELSSAASLW